MSIEDFVENPPFPKFVQFETGTACNAKCLMCPHDKMKRKGTASWSTLSKIITQAVPHVSSACPFLMQEPMLEPRLPAILANIKQNNPNCTTVVYSNMSVLPDNIMKPIVDHGLLDELHISFYGPTEALYKKWQPPLNKAKTIENIKRIGLYRVKRKRFRPLLILHVLSVPEIMDAIDGYKDVAPYVDRMANVQFDTFHGDIPDYGGDQRKYMGEPAPRTPCQRLWTALNVHFNGSVVPCCIDYQDEHVLGNINENTLQEIWSGQKFQSFRRLHIEGRWNEIAMCKNCRVHEYQFGHEWVEYWVDKQKARRKKVYAKVQHA